VQDQYGSVRWRKNVVTNATEGADYFPFGSEKPAATSNGRQKFGTYVRDAETGLDYADQRYFASVAGRFMTADPSGAGELGEPGGLAQYSYASGDPINGYDSSGLDVDRLGLVYSPSPTCWSERITSVIGKSDINSWLQSDEATLALQVWFEFEYAGTDPVVDDMWTGIANVYKNRWEASEPSKVMLGLKRRAEDPLTFEQMIFRSSSSGDRHFHMEGKNVVLDGEERARLVSILNSAPDSGTCRGLARSFQLSISVYRGQIRDNTGGAVSYIHYWSPTSPWTGSNPNITNPFGGTIRPTITRQTGDIYRVINGHAFTVRAVFYTFPGIKKG
jgi:RHS repeat-associated protein